MIDLGLPQHARIPLVLDSPHSGTLYPDDFHYIIPQLWLRQTEDSFVDDLFSCAPSYGAAFLKANFTRSYIDVNRAMDDLDPTVITGVLPFALEPTERSFSGYGLIRHLCRGQAVYASRLSIQHVQKRLQQCYLPYHAALKHVLDDAHETFGEVWHLNCHSMPSTGVANHRADFVLGDRDGVSSAPGFTHMLADRLRHMGYRVTHNDPYKGVEILRRYGHPRRGFHSVQLEINRALYMNEDTLKPSAYYAQLKNDLELLMRDVSAWIIAQTQSEQMVAE